MKLNFTLSCALHVYLQEMMNYQMQIVAMVHQKALIQQRVPVLLLKRGHPRPPRAVWSIVSFQRNAVQQKEGCM